MSNRHLASALVLAVSFVVGASHAQEPTASTDAPNPATPDVAPTPTVPPITPAPTPIVPTTTSAATSTPSSLPSVTATSSDLPFKAGYNNGFFISTRDESSMLRLRGLLQARASFEGTQDDVADLNKDNLSFAIQRAQIEVGGNLFTRNLGFSLRTEFGQGFTFIKDAFVDYTFVPGWLTVRVGQWKRPFSRQENVSDSQLAFIDRSLTNATFDGGRDIGLALHNFIDRTPPLEWSVGIFSGATDRPTFSARARTDPANPKATVVDNIRETNVPTLLQPTLAARLGYNYGDLKGYSEVDLDGTAPRFGVGVRLLEGFAIADAQKGKTRAELDGVVKAYGFDANSEAFVALNQTGGSTFAQTYAAAGVHAQLGYLLLGFVHPALRYDYIANVDTVASNHNDKQEASAALAVLLWGQNAQVQVDGSWVLDEQATTWKSTYRARSQVVLAF